MKKLKLKDSISFLKEKMNTELEEYINLVVSPISKNIEMENNLNDSILSLNKQIKLSEDCADIYDEFFNDKIQKVMNIKIDGNDLLKHMMFWSEKTDDDCVEMATVEDKLDAEQALINMIERDFALEFNKKVIDGLKYLGTDE